MKKRVVLENFDHQYEIENSILIELDVIPTRGNIFWLSRLQDNELMIKLYEWENSKFYYIDDYNIKNKRYEPYQYVYVSQILYDFESNCIFIILTKELNEGEYH